ncbi:hypothetical protein PHYPSEUDO_011018 [Phytophthora pseudosyringae]|uniref:Uncharacterized protein n=1 Tax=Phytophthora pseudosyringae TaxID=221518 RepID=A0A8T1VC28_9STRA|nr:hypothetical protein PHYPSEUDO_011018 [Phytophthora pseudosyringae]
MNPAKWSALGVVSPGFWLERATMETTISSIVFFMGGVEMLAPDGKRGSNMQRMSSGRPRQKQRERTLAQNVGDRPVNFHVGTTCWSHHVLNLPAWILCQTQLMQRGT